MFSKIQQEKRNGFSREAAARHLELSWATVDRYWDMTPDDYESARQQLYKSMLFPHNDIILKWLTAYSDVSAAQIRDWLEEHYGEVFNERTVRNYVARMRQLHSLPKLDPARNYGCVPEQPPDSSYRWISGHITQFAGTRTELHCISPCSFSPIPVTNTLFGKTVRSHPSTSCERWRGVLSV